MYQLTFIYVKADVLMNLNLNFQNMGVWKSYTSIISILQQ